MTSLHDGDIVAPGTVSSHSPVATRSGPPTIPQSNDVTETKIQGRWYSPEAAHIAGVKAPPTYRDRLSYWFPGLIFPTPPGLYPRQTTNTTPITTTYHNNTYQTMNSYHPWIGSLLLTGVAGIIYIVRHRLAISQIPFGVILVHKSSKLPISKLYGLSNNISQSSASIPTSNSTATSITTKWHLSSLYNYLTYRVPLSVPLSITHDPRFVNGDAAITLDQAIRQWYRRYRMLGILSGISTGLAFFNIILAPQSHVTAVGQLGERR